MEEPPTARDLFNPGARTSNAPLTQVPPLCAPSRNLLAAEVSMFLLASEMGTVQGLGSRLCPHRHDKLLVGHRLVWRWRRTQARGLSALTPMPTIYSSGYPLRFGACEPSVKNVQCMHSTALGGTAESEFRVQSFYEQNRNCGVKCFGGTGRNQVPPIRSVYEPRRARTQQPSDHWNRHTLTHRFWPQTLQALYRKCVAPGPYLMYYHNTYVL